MKRCTNSRQSALALAALCLGLVAASVTARAAQGDVTPGALPPSSHPGGLSYGEWGARWWQWVLSIPPATNPLLGGDCAVGQSGHVWFLVGTLGSDSTPVTRSCTIPTGTMLFFPVINTFYANEPGETTTPDEARAIIAPFIDAATVEVTVDGVAVNAVRQPSPVFSITLPADNILGAPAGVYAPAVADGYYVLLAPLPPGEHTIQFSAQSLDGFSLDVTYNITVVPGRG